ncbi:hypothetical protein [Mediterraneibacter massiliensis]|uniref:hypothetical protein n=1 Tax=Mediterraneibacter massiliensis TaxID=1720300 RepID=UPI0022E3E2C9|nr:hypothetical protein [Mediterraneibacter massiliensis]
MRVPKREELLPLCAALKEMTVFLEKDAKNRKPYFYRFLNAMENNIRIGMYFSAEDTEQLGKILVRDWSAANDKIVGIPECFSFLKAEGRSTEDILLFISLIEKIGVFFR